MCQTVTSIGDIMNMKWKIYTHVNFSPRVSKPWMVLRRNLCCVWLRVILGARIHTPQFTLNYNQRTLICRRTKPLIDRREEAICNQLIYWVESWLMSITIHNLHILTYFFKSLLLVLYAYPMCATHCVICVCIMFCVSCLCTFFSSYGGEKNKQIR